MMPAGRPPLFETAEAIEKKIDEYFVYIKGEWHEETLEVKGMPIVQKVWDRHSETPALTGLAYFLGFESRQSIYDYEKTGEFSYAIKRARLRIESSYEQYLLSQASTGAIFALKNFGWADKQEITNTNLNYNTEVTPEQVKAISDKLDESF